MRFIKPTRLYKSIVILAAEKDLSSVPLRLGPIRPCTEQISSTVKCHTLIVCVASTKLVCCVTLSIIFLIGDECNYTSTCYPCTVVLCVLDPSFLGQALVLCIFETIYKLHSVPLN